MKIKMGTESLELLFKTAGFDPTDIEHRQDFEDIKRLCDQMHEESVAAARDLYAKAVAQGESPLDAIISAVTWTDVTLMAMTLLMFKQIRDVGSNKHLEALLSKTLFSKVQGKS